MRIEVRLFAMQRAQTGQRSVSLDLPEGADVAAAWAALVTDLPVLAPSAPSVRFARNGRYVEVDERLSTGDELANRSACLSGDGAAWVTARGNTRAGTSRTMGTVANQSRTRLRRTGAVAGRASETHFWPSQNTAAEAPFGNPADLEGPVALRPRLATGVLFRGSIAGHMDRGPMASLSYGRGERHDGMVRDGGTNRACSIRVSK